MAEYNFWRNKKVLVTGYEGFLGSNLTKSLLNFGAKVIGLDIITHRKNTILEKTDFKRVKVIKGSVENYKLINKILSVNKIEIIFHLAAQAIVGKCLKNPLKTFSTNIKGSWNILEASRGNDRIKAIVIASSDKAYGIQNDLPYKEDYPLIGCHPYDVSKSCADLLATSYFHTYNLPVCITRCGNIFGPGDYSFSRIIPDTIKSALQNKTLAIRSDGKFTRDYIYVKDIINGYLKLVRKMYQLRLFGEAFNFSNERPISVLELVRTIYKLIDKKPNYKILTQAKYEIKHQYLSAKKAKKILGWKPRYNLEDGLREVIKWHKDFLIKEKYIKNE